MRASPAEFFQPAQTHGFEMIFLHWIPLWRINPVVWLHAQFTDSKNAHLA
jgi:hypothetical protein